MPRAGEWFENTVTGERARLDVSPDDTGGRRLQAQLWVQPKGAVMAAHVHDHLHERFTVLDGELAVVLDGRPSVAMPGDVVDVPPGTPHDWSNQGSQVASVRVLAYLEGGDRAGAATVATLLLVIALVVIILLDVIQRRVSRRG